MLFCAAGRSSVFSSSPRVIGIKIFPMNDVGVDQIDWLQWQPTQRANLCFVIRGRKILLIRKKRGLGAGKFNGPGGRIEDGETPLASAIRETEEEIGVTPID